MTMTAFTHEQLQEAARHSREIVRLSSVLERAREARAVLHIDDGAPVSEDRPLGSGFEVFITVSREQLRAELIVMIERHVAVLANLGIRLL